MQAAPSTTRIIEDVTLTHAVAAAASHTGAVLLQGYSTANRVADASSLMAAIGRNEQQAHELRQTLESLRPTAHWLDDERQSTALPDGEWWVVDSVEGNINHVHGLPEWGVSVTLVRDGQPALAVVRQPATNRTYTAVRGGGAFLDGKPLTASTKTSLATAVVITGQAEVGQQDTYRTIGESVIAMLDAALLVRMQVPSTFGMLLIAEGHGDAFWQYAPTLPGVAAGVLFVTEAGGRVSTTDGSAWQPGADTIVVAAPGVHGQVVEVLRTCR